MSQAIVTAVQCSGGGDELIRCFDSGSGGDDDTDIILRKTGWVTGDARREIW